jgi:hypothetical protein
MFALRGYCTGTSSPTLGLSDDDEPLGLGDERLLGTIIKSRRFGRGAW